MTLQLRLNRILASGVIALLLTLYIDHDYTRWGRLGRAAFLDYQAGRFDRYMGPDHLHSIPILGSVLITILLGIVYEGSAAVFAKILRTDKP